MSRKNQETYSIGDTALRANCSQKQIRNWEARGYIPEAGRVISGVRAYRRFTQDQIRIITDIKYFLDQGFTLSAAAKLAAGNKEIIGGNNHAK